MVEDWGEAYIEPKPTGAAINSESTMKFVIAHEVGHTKGFGSAEVDHGFGSSMEAYSSRNNNNSRYPAELIKNFRKGLKWEQGTH